MPSQPTARPPSRWLYLLPVCLLITAGWTWRDQFSPTESFAPDIAAESAAEEFDPRRYVAVDDEFVEDAATGVRLRAVEGLSPSEVFAEAYERQGSYPGGIPSGIAPGGVAQNGVFPNNSSTGGAQQNPQSVVNWTVDDHRFGMGPRPAGVEVTALGVKTWVIAIGVDANRALRVPKRADIIGWWSGGSVPGELGPTVLVGHYDSRSRAGVFAKLGDIEIGENIVVTQTDGSKYIYYVTELEKLKKSAFPTEKVYGWTPETTLRLVTCGGKFDRKTGHYEDNTIAYAELLSFTPSPYRPSTLAIPTFLNATSDESTTTIGSAGTPNETRAKRPTEPVAGIPVPSGSTTRVSTTATPNSGGPSIGSSTSPDTGSVTVPAAPPTSAPVSVSTTVADLVTPPSSPVDSGSSSSAEPIPVPSTPTTIPVPVVPPTISDPTNVEATTPVPPL
jgi:sortase (surface protein transpeptidase)